METTIAEQHDAHIALVLPYLLSRGHEPAAARELAERSWLVGRNQPPRKTGSASPKSREETDWALHIVLVLLTGGLWLIPLLCIILARPRTRPRA